MKKVHLWRENNGGWAVMSSLSSLYIHEFLRPLFVLCIYHYFPPTGMGMAKIPWRLEIQAEVVLVGGGGGNCNRCSRILQGRGICKLGVVESESEVFIGDTSIQ